MTTPPEVWIPAFEWQRELTVENTQGYQDPRTSFRWCVLCETWVSADQSKKHVARHRAEREASPMAAAGTKNQKSSKTEVPQDVIDRMVTMAKEGMGITAIAKALTDEKVPTPGKSKQWHPPVVRGYIMRETGAAGIKELRESAPLVRPQAKDEAPKPATRVGKQNGAAESSDEMKAKLAEGKEAKPDPKPPATKKRSGRKTEAQVAKA